jgi:hypothetical protein
MAVGAKICIRCKQDCSTRPRTKDAQGRYLCRECQDAKAAEAPIAVADEPLPIGIVEDPAPTGLVVCPSCGSSIPNGGALCVQCGYDVRKGAKLATDRGAAPEAPSPIPPRQGKCGKCGYSLKGLKAPRCPECGTVVGRLTDRERRRRENAETVRWSYLKPLIQLGIGLGGAAVYYAATGQAAAILPHALLFMIMVPFGLVAFLACCGLWIGFDAPIHMLMLRLAAVYALVGLTTIIAQFIPLGMIQLLVVIFVYVSLLSESLDLELTDAIIVAIVTFGLMIFVYLAVAAWLFAHT